MGDGRAVVLPSLLLCRFCFKKARSLPLRITCILKNLPAQEQNAKKYILLKAGISFRKVGMVGFAFVVSSNDRPPGHEGPWGTNNGSFHRPGSALAGTDWGGGVAPAGTRLCVRLALRHGDAYHMPAGYAMLIANVALKVLCGSCGDTQILAPSIISIDSHSKGPVAGRTFARLPVPRAGLLDSSFKNICLSFD